jgi:hypothetical protein
MNDWNEPAGSGLFRRLAVFVIALALICLGIYYSSPSGKPKPVEQKNGGEKAAVSVTSRDCERRLDQALEGLHPERVVINSSRIDRVAELSQWAIECGDAETLARLSYTPGPNEKWLSGDMLSRTQAQGYSLRDAQHITIARLCGELAEKVAAKSDDPREQATALFDIIVRETELEPESAVKARPRTLLEALLIGRATASERAWMLATLLRQLRHDAVIIEPASKPEAWLIGVLRGEGDAWLFDPRLGTAIPSKQDAGSGLIVTQPATLAELRGDDSLLRRLDLEGFPYPLQASDLTTVNVRMVGDSSNFSERMARVQAMTHGDLMEIFDGLGQSALRVPGLVERVQKAGEKGLWNESQMSVWTYPEEQMTSYLSSGAESAPDWQHDMAVFGGPTVLSTVREGENQSRWVVQRLPDPLREVRMIHLAGKVSRALQLYLPIREQAHMTGQVPDDPALIAKLQAAIPTNLEAADYAVFWTAATQMEMGRGELAVNTLQQYQRNYPLGKMRAAAPELFVRALVVEGAAEPAAKWIEQIPPRQRSPRLAWLHKRLQGSKENAADANPPTKTETQPPPAEPASNTPAPNEPPAEQDDRPPAPPLATPDNET